MKCSKTIQEESIHKQKRFRAIIETEWQYLSHNEIYKDNKNWKFFPLFVESFCVGVLCVVIKSKKLYNFIITCTKKVRKRNNKSKRKEKPIAIIFQAYITRGRIFLCSNIYASISYFTSDKQGQGKMLYHEYFYWVNFFVGFLMYREWFKGEQL